MQVSKGLTLGAKPEPSPRDFWLVEDALQAGFLLANSRGTPATLGGIGRRGRMKGRDCSSQEMYSNGR